MHSDAPVKGLADWPQLFDIYRSEKVRGGEIVSGRLLPGLDTSSPAVRDALDRWPGPYESRRRAGAWELLLYRPAERRERWWLHVGLLIVTLLSTILAGDMLAGQHPIGFAPLPLGTGWSLPIPVSLRFDALLLGAPFGVALVAILFLHESGHYFTARHHRINVSPPYFIPFPPYVSVIGTLGAFIRLRSPLMNRRALLEVGVAGPLASFLASLPVLWWGLLHSRVISPAPPGIPGPYLIRFMDQEIWLGGSIIFSGMVRLLLDFGGGGEVLLLHPVAFAGWVGLFVTALNLLPISQLDGGHILYSLLGDRQQKLAFVFFALLVPLGFLWPGWWVWAAVVFIVGRGRVGHPPVFNKERGLKRTGMTLVLAAALVFILCVVAVPFRL
ncbi:MAG: site-2 protease family protein [Gemmatimonadota bacterium]